MKRPHNRKKTALVAGAALMALLLTGCSIADPIVHVGSPSPLASESVTTSQTASPVTPQPTAIGNEDAEPTAALSSAEPTEAIGSGAYTIAADTSESQKIYYSEQADENALRVENGVEAKLDGASIEKRSGDASSIADTIDCGLNAAVLVREGATLSLLSSEVISSPLGAGGVFTEGGTVNLDTGHVRVSGDSSYGLSATAGGSILTRETDIATQGENSPAIRTVDEGNVSLDGGIVTTGGKNSPLVDASGIVIAKNATLRASVSAACMVNAGASVALTDCAVSGRMGDVFSSDALISPYCIALYRDGENSEQKSVFSMTRGALTAQKGDLFYVTNTSATIYLEGVALSHGENNLLLRVSGNDGSFGWGKAGSNGADCTLSANNQSLTGDIVVDELSSVSLVLKGDSDYTGTINTANTAKVAKVTLGDGCTWTLTGNAYLTSFSGRVSGIVTNGFTVYVNGQVLAG